MKKIQTFFLRVSSSCNLSCKYCYVFKHADQSWKNRPAIISSEVVDLFSQRLAEHVKETKLEKVFIIFHGGEPLIIGHEAIRYICNSINGKVGKSTKIEFSLQTNGGLLDQNMLELLAEFNIAASVSIDGPKEIHDLNRLTKSGESIFDSIENNLFLLRDKYSKIYAGIIGVINPYANPDDIFSYYELLDPPAIDMLLPDANYLALPSGRDENPDLYLNWLIQTFDCWFDKYPKLIHKTFEAILKGLTGLEVNTDTFGLGELTYLTIETDGSYHSSDILKVAYEGASELGMSLKTSSFIEAMASPKVKEYNDLLSEKFLPAICQSCSVFKVCGSGSLPHRYGKNSFNNPTIYCEEMKALINHANTRLKEEKKKMDYNLQCY